MTRMLASVRALDEALVALEGGADLIDLKEPSRGALGSLDHAAVRICTRAIGGRRPVSATIGDIPSMEPSQVLAAVDRLSSTGVDYVKIGIFPGPLTPACIGHLAQLSGRVRMVAVLFADAPCNVDLVPEIARAGFAGAMLDTARKTGESLRDWHTRDELRRFLGNASGRGLLTGLAGSLRLEDVDPLLELAPDFLGFRGALCRNGSRGEDLDPVAFDAIRRAIPQSASMPQATSAAA